MIEGVEDHCRLSYDENACDYEDLGDAMIKLSDATFDKIFRKSGNAGDTRYVYSVDNLRQNEDGKTYYKSPCTPNTRSRWMLDQDCTSQVTVTPATEQVFADMISRSSDTNPLLRDLNFPSVGISCDSGDTTR